MRKIWICIILSLLVIFSSTCIAASLGQEWKYVTSGQWDDGRNYSFYYNSNNVNYNHITGRIEAEIAMKYTTNNEKPLRAIMFAKVDYDTKKHKQRVYGRRYEIDDKDLTVSKGALKSILNFGRYASALLIPLDGGFTTAFINGFTEVAGEDTAVEAMSKFVNPDFKNEEDLRENNQFTLLMHNENDTDNILYMTVREAAGIQPQWDAEKFDFDEDRFLYLYEGKNNKFYFDKDSITYVDSNLSDGTHNFAFVNIVVLPKKTNVNANKMFLACLDLTNNGEGIYVDGFQVYDGVLTKISYRKILEQFYNNYDVIDKEEWNKLKKLEMKERINPNEDYYENLIDKEKLLKLITNKELCKEIGESIGKPNVLKWVRDEKIFEILNKIKEEKGL